MQALSHKYCPLYQLSSEKGRRALSKKGFLFGCSDRLSCVSVGVCGAEEDRVSEGERWTAASIILSFRKHFCVVILATWAHCGLMSASEYIIFIFSSLKFSQWIWLSSAMCVCLCLCRRVGVFCGAVSVEG